MIVVSRSAGWELNFSPGDKKCCRKWGPMPLSHSSYDPDIFKRVLSRGAAGLEQMKNPGEGYSWGELCLYTLRLVEKEAGGDPNNLDADSAEALSAVVWAAYMLAPGTEQTTNPECCGQDEGCGYYCYTSGDPNDMNAGPSGWLMVAGGLTGMVEWLLTGGGYLASSSGTCMTGVWIYVGCQSRWCDSSRGQHCNFR